MEGLNFDRVSLDNKRMLEEVFSVEEVREALNGCDGNKVLGPDRFNVNFIKKCLKEIEGDFMSFMDEFFLDGANIGSLNHSFITLIPEVSNPRTLRDYRPISLVN